MADECPIEHAVRQWGGEGYDVDDAQEELARLKKDRDALLAACKDVDEKTAVIMGKLSGMFLVGASTKRAIDDANAIRIILDDLANSATAAIAQAELPRSSQDAENRRLSDDRQPDGQIDP